MYVRMYLYNIHTQINMYVFRHYYYYNGGRHRQAYTNIYSFTYVDIFIYNACTIHQVSFCKRPIFFSCFLVFFRTTTTFPPKTPSPPLRCCWILILIHVFIVHTPYMDSNFNTFIYSTYTK